MSALWALMRPLWLLRLRPAALSWLRFSSPWLLRLWCVLKSVLPLALMLPLLSRPSETLMLPLLSRPSETLMRPAARACGAVGAGALSVRPPPVAVVGGVLGWLLLP